MPGTTLLRECERIMSSCQESCRPPAATAVVRASPPRAREYRLGPEDFTVAGGGDAAGGAGRGHGAMVQGGGRRDAFGGPGARHRGRRPDDRPVPGGGPGVCDRWEIGSA